MYDKPFSRRNPGCIVLLVDRSDSMKGEWGDSSVSMADGAARAINEILLELCIKCTKEVGGVARDYFSLLILGYGIRPVSGGEGVESALGGALAGRNLVPIPDLYRSPIGVREEPSIDAVLPGSRQPYWVESAHGYRTPMCEAIATAGSHIFEWVGQHPESFPPIVINITDGMVTDSPYEGADLAEWARRLTSIETTDGATLLFNIFLSPWPDRPLMFPVTADGLPNPGPELFSISSPLPQPMIDSARNGGQSIAPGARGLGFQANLGMLVRFLEIGTRVNDIRDR